MGQALIIHEGFGCPDRLRERGEKYRAGHDIRYGTARLGAEATDPGQEDGVEVADVVVTDSPEVADYYQDRDVDVEGVATLPESIPKREELGTAFLLNESAVRQAAIVPPEDPSSLESIDGIGEASADKIRKAVGVAPKHTEE